MHIFNCYCIFMQALRALLICTELRCNLSNSRWIDSRQCFFLWVFISFCFRVVLLFCAINMHSVICKLGSRDSGHCFFFHFIRSHFQLQQLYYVLHFVNGNLWQWCNFACSIWKYLDLDRKFHRNSVDGDRDKVWIDYSINSLFLCSHLNGLFSIYNFFFQMWFLHIIFFLNDIWSKSPLTLDNV